MQVILQSLRSVTMLSQESLICHSNLKRWILGLTAPHMINQEDVHPSGMPCGDPLTGNPCGKNYTPNTFKQTTQGQTK